MSARSVRFLAFVGLSAVLLLLVVSNRPSGAAGLSTQSLGEGSPALTATDLVNSLLGGGITTSNVNYTGAGIAAGKFSGGGSVVGFDAGIVLSTGDIKFVLPPNSADDVTWPNFTNGDPDLTALSGYQTYDAAVLEFDFVPASEVIAFRYVFASDEYNEWVNKQFNGVFYNDAFAFYVNGTNCALVPGSSTPITVNTVNNGNPFGTPPLSNPQLFRNNDPQDVSPADALATEMDGLTVTLTCIAAVNQGVQNHIKLAIADASDREIDSNVFIEASSLVGSGPGDTDCNGLINSVDALQVLRAAAHLSVSAQCMPNGDVNCGGGLTSVDALLILRFSALLPVTGLPPGCPPIGSGPPSPTPTSSPSPTPGGLQLTAGDYFFNPTQLDVTAGQPFSVTVTNSGPSTHNVRIAGDDNQFDNSDDIVSSPAFIPGGESAQLNGTLTSPGSYNFRCDLHPGQMTGTITAH